MSYLLCVFHLTMFTLLGCRGGSWTRTQTGTLQGEILPRKTRLLLQLALQHKHTHTHRVINAHTPVTSTRGHKGEVK